MNKRFNLRFFIWLAIAGACSLATAIGASTSCWYENNECINGVFGGCTPLNTCYDWGSTNTCTGYNIPAGGNQNATWRYITKKEYSRDVCQTMMRKDCEQCVPPTDGSQNTCSQTAWCVLFMYPDVNCPNSAVCWINNYNVDCMGSRDTPTTTPPPDDYCGHSQSAILACLFMSAKMLGALVFGMIPCLGFMQ